MIINNLLFLFASWLSYIWLFILCRVWEWHVNRLAWCIWLPTTISLKRRSSVSCGRGWPCPIGNFDLTEPLPEEIRSLLSMHTVPFFLPFCSPFIIIIIIIIIITLLTHASVPLERLSLCSQPGLVSFTFIQHFGTCACACATNKFKFL